MAQGILGRIGSGIQGILGNPVVQGLGTAAAFGPAGLLAIPYLSNIKKNAEAQNEEQRRKLLEQKRQREVVQQLSGLLGQRSTVQGPPGQIPLESVSGPTSMLDVPGKKGMVPTLATGAGRQEALGLLGEIAPEAVAQGVLGQMFPQPQQERSEPAAIREMERLGFPMTPEGFAAYNQLKSQGDSLEDDKTRLEIHKLMRELQGEVEAKDEEKAASARNIQSRLGRADRILGLTNRLEGSPLEPGRFASEARRPFISLVGEIAGMFGAEDFAQARDEEATAFDVLKKETSLFIGDMMAQLSDRGDRTTDAKLRQLERASATVEASPGAIRAIMKETIQTAIDEADRLGVELEGRAEYERLLKKLEEQGPRGSKGATMDLGDGVTLEFID